MGFMFNAYTAPDVNTIGMPMSQGNYQNPELTNSQYQTGLSNYQGTGDHMFGAQNAQNTNLAGAATMNPNAQGAQLGQTSLSPQVQLGQAQTYGAAQLNGGQYNSTFGQEQGLANQLQAQSQGQGPSVAQVTANQQAQQNLSNSMAQLGSQRGSTNPALAQQAALNAGANAQQGAAQQAVMGRTQEELGAQANLGNTLGSMNNQAQAFAGANANLTQQQQMANQSAQNQFALTQGQMNLQNNQFNAGSQNTANLTQGQMNQQAGLANQSDANQFALAQGQMNQQTSLANQQNQFNTNQLNAQQYNNYMNQVAQMNLAQQQGMEAYSQNATGYQESANSLNFQGQQAAAKNDAALIGGAMSAAGGMMGMSDIRQKTKIQMADKEMNHFLTGFYKSRMF